MMIALSAMLGRGLPGGGFSFGHGSMNGVGNPRVDTPAPTMPVGDNPAGLAIPVARICDMLLHPGEAYQFAARRASTGCSRCTGPAATRSIIISS